MVRKRENRNHAKSGKFADKVLQLSEIQFINLLFDFFNRPYLMQTFGRNRRHNVCGICSYFRSYRTDFVTVILTLPCIPRVEFWHRDTQFKFIKANYLQVLLEINPETVLNFRENRLFDIVE